MDTQKNSKGFRTFLEHCWFASIAVAFILTMQVLDFFTNLHGTSWICFFVASFTLMLLGGSLIGFAKLPVYRSGRFFTFGLKSVPEPLQRYYRWGWGVFLFGVVLSLGLFLSRP